MLDFVRRLHLESVSFEFILQSKFEIEVLCNRKKNSMMPSE